jgi:hypothetical protein
VPLRVPSQASPDDKETRAEYLAGVADRHAGVAHDEAKVVDGNSVPAR